MPTPVPVPLPVGTPTPVPVPVPIDPALNGSAAFNIGFARYSDVAGSGCDFLIEMELSTTGLAESLSKVKANGTWPTGGSGDLIGGAMAAAGNLGKASAAADALTFSSKVRAAIQRLGSALEAEWREREKERDVAREAEQRRTFCQRCGARWPDDVVTVCPHCGAPREA